MTCPVEKRTGPSRARARGVLCAREGRDLVVFQLTDLNGKSRGVAGGNRPLRRVALVQSKTCPKRRSLPYSTPVTGSVGARVNDFFPCPMRKLHPVDQAPESRPALALDREAIVKDRRNGDSLGTIARNHRVSRTTVHRVLSEHASEQVA